MHYLFNAEHKAMAEQSVLCWLATADEFGQPNVSPKEIFAIVDDEHIVIANIASPQSAKNIRKNEKVCVSFIDVFAQKGFKVFGIASDVKPQATDYKRCVEPLQKMVGDRFPIHSVFLVRATIIEPILAPSYRLYPLETTEASQVRAALETYGVQRVIGDVQPPSDSPPIDLRQHPKG
jgi:predicted pyridoxine 5'-phosphate oxidase superfamily flavin-nucleotide-binding protein